MKTQAAKKKKKIWMGNCKKKCLFSELGHWQGLEEANLRFLINDSIFFFFFPGQLGQGRRRRCLAQKKFGLSLGWVLELKRGEKKKFKSTIVHFIGP